MLLNPSSSLMYGDKKETSKSYQRTRDSSSFPALRPVVDKLFKARATSVSHETSKGRTRTELRSGPRVARGM